LQLHLSQEGGVTTISVDANFGLVRKHNSGSSPLPSDYANAFFLDAEEVDAFVKNYGSENLKDNVCICIWYSWTIYSCCISRAEETILITSIVFSG
jgi:hypothetical protein